MVSGLESEIDSCPEVTEAKIDEILGTRSLTPHQKIVLGGYAREYCGLKGYPIVSGTSRGSEWGALGDLVSAGFGVVESLWDIQVDHPLEEFTGRTVSGWGDEGISFITGGESAATTLERRRGEVARQLRDMDG
jgi:hypothetical protein|tara:strand:+ start:310 stop:711 length:402 start_codon:yes stop_codon:yes gene_type:complete